MAENPKLMLEIWKKIFELTLTLTPSRPPTERHGAWVDGSSVAGRCCS